MELKYSTIQEDMEERNKKWVFEFLLRTGVFIFPKEEMKAIIAQCKNIWNKETRKEFLNFLLKIGVFIFPKEGVITAS